MKKLVIIVSCFALCFTLTACKIKVNRDGADQSAPSSTSSTESSASVGGLSMEKFIESIQGQIDQMAPTFESAGMALDVSARGNSLVYTYQYTVDIGDASVVKDTLESAMEGMSSTFSNVFSMLKTAVPDAQSVIVECLDKDGNVIFSKEYK